jgi:hypothetical protein
MGAKPALGFDRAIPIRELSGQVMQIHHGGGNVGMAQLVFYAYDIEPHFQQVRGIAVAQGMDANRFVDACLLDIRTKSMADSFAADLASAYLPVEKPALRVGDFNVLLYPFQCERRNRYIAVFFVLALADMHQPAVKIDIV